MKKISNVVLLSALIVTTTGCSMFGGKKADNVEVPKTTAVTQQKLSTFFEDDGIRVN